MTSAPLERWMVVVLWFARHLVVRLLQRANDWEKSCNLVGLMFYIKFKYMHVSTNRLSSCKCLNYHLSKHVLQNTGSLGFNGVIWGQKSFRVKWFRHTGLNKIQQGVFSPSDFSESFIWSSALLVSKGHTTYGIFLFYFLCTSPLDSWIYCF